MAEWLSLAEAIAANVHDGDSVAMEGFTHLIPFAAGHEIIRQRRRELSLIRMTPDLIYDQLIGAGCAREADIFVGRKSGSRIVAPLSRCGGERLAAVRSRSKSGATATWPMRMWRARRTCRSPFCADMRDRILPA